MIKVLLLLTLFAALSHSHQHLACQFEKYNQDLKPISKSTPPDIGVLPAKGRLLATITRNKMRITIDTSNFTTISTGRNGAATTTTTNLAFILKAMRVATSFYMSRLKVYPITTIMAPLQCVDYYPSNNDRNYGIAGSDLHIYVLYTTDSNITYAANGKSCKYYGDHNTNPPDATLQLNRPTMGRILFNTYNLIDRETALTNRLFQSITATSLHELMHILGMDSTLFGSWLNPDPTLVPFGDAYGNNNTVIDGTPYVSSSRVNTKFLVTPYVKAWAQNHFGCPTLPGMILQNEDGSNLTGGGSHWQRLAAYDELMTATSWGAVKGFTGLSFAVLKDMGWYTVDDTFNETTNYGYQKGCSFVLEACYSATSFPQFCNAATQSSISKCGITHFSKAFCSAQSSLLADGCGVYYPYFNCVDSAVTQSYKTITFQQYNTNSFCVGSIMGNLALSSTLQSRCYPYSCGSNSITFTIGTYTIVCLATEEGVHKTLSAYTGDLECPNFISFCTMSRKPCPNWCNQNGFCMRGICTCYTGFYGDDCSQTQCSTTTFYNPLTNLCVTLCPSGYYQNIYSQTCDACQSPCQQCFGQPTICTGCISTATNPQYFYNGTCYSACPAGTFKNNFNCSVCDNSVFCATCDVTATNCTSCFGGKYLNQPVYGTCISSCPLIGTYTVADVVNMVCVITCASSLVLINNTCTYCPGSTFKFISNNTCISACPDNYYADNTSHICNKCHSSCLTCFGSAQENCLSCSPSQTLRYLLLNMCWSTCPGGFYPNDTASACTICPSELNCGNCTQINGLIKCTSCSYGYYLNSNTSICSSSCLPNQFANRGNNSCQNCDSTCLTCAGPGSSYCRSCNSPALFLSNLTGGYCISSCNQTGWVQSGSNCFVCDSSCLACSGTASYECTACLSGTYLDGGRCKYVCPNLFYPSDLTNKCENCDIRCTYCFGPTVDNCTGCLSTLVLYNFTCTSSCPSGYTVNQWNVCSEKWLLFWLAMIFLLY